MDWGFALGRGDVRFKKGDLFEVVVRNLNLTREGFATGEKIGKDLLLHEQIDLHAYPSCNDFFGKIRQLQVYKTALTDPQLTSLTT